MICAWCKKMIKKVVFGMYHLPYCCRACRKKAETKGVFYMSK